ncbi:thiosulfate oxidation carrier complex protein SoxZ [Gammaproteobacteria bacterium]|nr:thiosulfate oxidation carrier complex protein SoxZ [Gammaproteobacteria bacterium]
MSTIKLRAKESKGVVTVKAIIKHPMETGQRKNKKTGEKIPAHFIQQVVCKANNDEVITINWGPAVSKNPYLTFAYMGSKGDTIELTWEDNQGNKDSLQGEVK